MSVKNFSLKMMNDRVFVEREEEEEERTSSGFVIPATASKEKSNLGKVIEVGPGALNKNGERQALEVKKGDRVLFAQYAGTKHKFKGSEKEYLILKADDILAKIIE
jgi:chaperonin GroES